MGFERFGKVSFTSETRAADFVTYLDSGKVMATRCQGCGRAYFPPRVECADCLSSDVEWFELSEGKLITYTVVNYGPTGFEDDAPYILALAEFGSGVKVFGRLDRQIPESEIEIGMEVRLSPVELPDQKISYRFEKA